MGSEMPIKDNMMKFIGGLFSDNNDVNEDTVMGFLCFVAMCVAGFMPLVGIEVFFGFMSCMLLFFGKNLTKMNIKKIKLQE